MNTKQEIFRLLRILLTLSPYITMPVFTFLLALKGIAAWGWFLIATVILLGNLSFKDDADKSETEATFI
jgi:hypothetical protein